LINFLKKFFLELRGQQIVLFGFQL